MKNKLILCFVSTFFLTCVSHAEEIATNMAEMQAMDKITGRVSIIDVPVGGAVSFGSFSIVVRDCRTTTEEEIPENFAFVDVSDKSFNQEEYNIFKGWMFSSSPAVNAVEHPIYDVWLLRCFNGTPQKELLLSKKALDLRDHLPGLNEVVMQTNEMKQNTFVLNEPKNITFKDEMYKEAVDEKVQNPLAQKQDGQPQNLLNIDFDYISKADMVELSQEEFEKAVEEQAKILNNVQTDISTLENQVQEKLDDQYDLEMNAEIDAELRENQ